MGRNERSLPGRHSSVFFSCPGSAWACRGNEAQPLGSFRTQAEPGYEDTNRSRPEILFLSSEAKNLYLYRGFEMFRCAQHDTLKELFG